MDRLDALDLGKRLRAGGMRVLGLRPLKGPDRRAIVLMVKGIEMSIRRLEDLRTVFDRAGVRGARYQQFDLCSLCYGRLRAPDGHYHERVVEYSQTSAGAEAVCCHCVFGDQPCRAPMGRQVTTMPELTKRQRREIEREIQREREAKRKRSRERRERRKRERQKETEDAGVQGRDEPVVQLPPRRRR